MIEATYNQLFRSQFEAGFLQVATKLIKSAPEVIQKFKIDQKEIDQNLLTFSIKFAFLIKFDFFGFFNQQ